MELHYFENYKIVKDSNILENAVLKGGTDSDPFWKRAEEVTKVEPVTAAQ